MRKALSAVLQRLARRVAPCQDPIHPAFYAALQRQGSLSPRDVHATAVHEAGHALTYAALRPLPAYVRVSLAEPSAQDDVIGHVTRIVYPHALEDLSFLRWQMLMLLAGQAAERLLLPEETMGAAQDLAQWTSLAQDYLGLCTHDLYYANPAYEYQHASNHALVVRTLSEQRAQVHEFLQINRAVLVSLAGAIERQRQLDADALRPFLARVQMPEGFPVPDLSGVSTFAINHEPPHNGRDPTTIWEQSP